MVSFAALGQKKHQSQIYQGFIRVSQIFLVAGPESMRWSTSVGAHANRAARAHSCIRMLP